MASVGSQLLPSPRAAGISLMAGVALTLFPSLFTPGGPFISPVDPTDYVGTIEVLAQYPSLAHLTAMLAVFSMLLYGYGLLGLLGLRGAKGNFRSSLLQYGIMTSLFGWGIFLIAMGKRHMSIHLVQRSVNAAEDPETQALLYNAALSGYADMAGLILAFLSIYPFASAMVGLGLMPRLSSLNAYKIAAMGLVVIGAAGFLNFLTAQHFPAFNLNMLVYINNMLLSIGGICLFVVGLGMYRKRESFLSDEPSEQYAES